MLKHAELNRELVRKELPTVNEDVHNWRMAQTTNGIVRQHKKEAESAALSANQSVQEADAISEENSLPPLRDQPGIAEHLNNDHAATSCKHTCFCIVRKFDIDAAG